MPSVAKLIATPSPADVTPDYPARLRSNAFIRQLPRPDSLERSIARSSRDRFTGNNATQTLLILLGPLDQTTGLTRHKICNQTCNTHSPNSAHVATPAFCLCLPCSKVLNLSSWTHNPQGTYSPRTKPGLLVDTSLLEQTTSLSLARTKHRTSSGHLPFGANHWFSPSIRELI